MAGGRYSRQIRFAPVGERGQEALGRATVLIVGIGALGTHSAEALARAGVGRLWLCDRDVVEPSNLQRQSLFTEQDAADCAPKAAAAAEHLRAINSEIRAEAFVRDCTREFLEDLPSLPDAVLDGTDNFRTRYLLNDFAVRRAVPFVYAGAVGAEATGMVVRPGVTGCLRCLWPEPPSSGDFDTCETAGILSPAVQAVTAFQVAETLKLLVAPEKQSQGLFHCDVWQGRYALLEGPRPPSPDCPVCSGKSFPALAGEPPLATTLCGRDAVQVVPPAGAAVDLDRLAARLAGAVTGLSRTKHLLRFEADGCSFRVFPGGRALLFGLSDPLRAQALYDRYVAALRGTP